MHPEMLRALAQAKHKDLLRVDSEGSEDPSSLTIRGFTSPGDVSERCSFGRVHA